MKRPELHAGRKEYEAGEGGERERRGRGGSLYGFFVLRDLVGFYRLIHPDFPSRPVHSLLDEVAVLFLLHRNVERVVSAYRCQKSDSNYILLLKLKTGDHFSQFFNKLRSPISMQDLCRNVKFMMNDNEFYCRL